MDLILCNKAGAQEVFTREAEGRASKLEKERRGKKEKSVKGDKKKGEKGFCDLRSYLSVCSGATVSIFQERREKKKEGTEEQL